MTVASLGLYFEDLQPGQIYGGGEAVSLDEDEIIAFGRAYDPQLFHTDPEAAKDTFFNGLAASGWHTAAVTMRLLVTQGPRVAGGTIGAGVEDLRWPRATRPGEALRIEVEVLDTRGMRSKPDLGLVRVRVTTLGDASETPAQVMVCTLVVPRRVM